ncbi:MAG TPA: glycoside hydrolase family 75 protein, partial [Candidatus Udaeobacter sp.]
LASTAPARKHDLRNAIAELRNEIGTLKKFSFLIGATDPFIVVPGTFTHGPDPVKVGDYALVVFGDAIYPAIVGDVGPNDKVGEASLRIAKELNALSTAYNRPVSDLKVSYIIFSGTAEKPFGPPDLDKINARCETLVKEIGGASVPLHHWESIIPSPTPTPSPSPSPSSTASGTPSPSPAPTFAFPVSTPVETVSPATTAAPKRSPAASRSPHSKRKP